jgi:ATP-dependent Clp protease ATP-binding subunit ClpC
MYERFTDRARKAMQLANQEAQRFNHEYIGTEHILLGLVKEGSGGLLGWFRRPGGVACQVLKALGVELEAVRCEVERVHQAMPGNGKLFKGRRRWTQRAKQSIEYAIDEARQLGHKYVGTEHLLLGLLREEEDASAVVLQDLGLRLNDVRLEVLDCLRQAE